MQNVSSKLELRKYNLDTPLKVYEQKDGVGLICPCDYAKEWRQMPCWVSFVTKLGSVAINIKLSIKLYVAIVKEWKMFSFTKSTSTNLHASHIFHIYI